MTKFGSLKLCLIGWCISLPQNAFQIAFFAWSWVSNSAIYYLQVYIYTHTHIQESNNASNKKMSYIYVITPKSSLMLLSTNLDTHLATMRTLRKWLSVSQWGEYKSSHKREIFQTALSLLFERLLCELLKVLVLMLWHPSFPFLGFASVLIQVLCSYVTLPLYALVSQVSSTAITDVLTDLKQKKSKIFDSNLLWLLSVQFFRWARLWSLSSSVSKLHQRYAHGT